MPKPEFFLIGSSPDSGNSMRLGRLLQEVTSYAEGEKEMAYLPPDKIRNDDPQRHDLYQLAVEVRRLRLLRGKCLPKAYFKNVPWDILLALYISTGKYKMSVTNLASELLSPLTTVMRWLSDLEGEGRVCHRDHPNDGRIRFLELTDVGRREMDNYFLELLRSPSFSPIKS